MRRMNGDKGRQGSRMPGPLGGTIGIVGGLIIFRQHHRQSGEPYCGGGCGWTVVHWQSADEFSAPLSFPFCSPEPGGVWF